MIILFLYRGNCVGWIIHVQPGQICGLGTQCHFLYSTNKDVIIKFISVAVSLDKTTRVEDWPGAFNGCTDCKQVHASSNLEELLLHLTSKERTQ